jgi:hypothetical protein
MLILFVVLGCLAVSRYHPLARDARTAASSLSGSP